MKDHIFKVLIDIEPHPKHRIEPDLEEKELAAIGYVVTQWSYLEHSILASTIELCSAKKTNPPMDAASPPQIGVPVKVTLQNASALNNH